MKKFTRGILILAVLTLAAFAREVAASGDERDDLVKGLWLEIPGFPKNAVLEFSISGGGEVRYRRALGEGVLTVERLKNVMKDGSAFTMDKVAKWVSDSELGVMEEDEIDVDENPGELTAIFKYPVATATYRLETEGGVSKAEHLFIFTADWVFHTHFGVGVAEESAEKYASPAEGWYKSMKLRDDGAKDAEVNDDFVEGLWLEVPGFPKNADRVFSFGDDGEVSSTRLDRAGGMMTLSVKRLKNIMNDGSAFTMDKVAKFVTGTKYKYLKEDDMDVDENPGALTAISEYPVAAATYKKMLVMEIKVVPDIFIFTDDWVFWVSVHTRGGDPRQVREKYASKAEGWYKSMKLRGGGSESKKTGGIAVAAARAEDVFVFEDGKWWAKADGELTEPDKDRAYSGEQPDLGFRWILVNPEWQDYAKGLQYGVLLYKEVAGKYSFLPLGEDADGFLDVTFSKDGKRALMVRHGAVRGFASLLVYDVEKRESVESLDYLTNGGWWLDARRFVFTLADENATRPDGEFGASVLLYDLAEGVIVLKQATAKEDFTVTGVSEDGKKISIYVTSVKSEKDWADKEKWQESEITVDVPAAAAKLR